MWDHIRLSGWENSGCAEEQRGSWQIPTFKLISIVQFTWSIFKIVNPVYQVMWLLFMNFFSFSLLNAGSITSFFMVWTLISPSIVWRWGAALLLTLILAIWQQTHLSQPNQCIMQHFYAIRSSNKSFIKCSPWESRKGKLNDLHLAGLIKCGFTFVSPKKNLWHPDIGMLLGSKINPPERLYRGRCSTYFVIT